MRNASGPVEERLRDDVGAVLRATMRAALADTDVRISAKTDALGGDLVTSADVAVQTRLADVLPGLLPGSEFAGEEGFEALSDTSRRSLWIVDPLDGTVNFASGLPLFGASIALVMDGAAVLGVVYDAVHDVVFDAVAGRGARTNGETMRWSGERASVSPIAVSSGFLSFALARSGGALLGEVRAISPRLRILGCQAVQLCWAASGRLRANVSVEAKLWDDAAGWLICSEAGAAYEIVGGGKLFPLSDSSNGVRGEDVFSVAGSRSDVAALLEIIEKATEWTE